MEQRKRFIWNADDDAVIKFYIFFYCLFLEMRRCRAIVKKKAFYYQILDCLCCCHIPSSCAACNARFRQQPCNAVSVPQYFPRIVPLGQVKIARDPGSTTITPYMASGGVISLAAYMELEAKKKARASAVQATKKVSFAKDEAEFILVFLWTHN